MRIAMFTDLEYDDGMQIKYIFGLVQHRVQVVGSRVEGDDTASDAGSPGTAARTPETFVRGRSRGEAEVELASSRFAGTHIWKSGHSPHELLQLGHYHVRT